MTEEEMIDKKTELTFADGEEYARYEIALEMFRKLDRRSMIAFLTCLISEIDLGLLKTHKGETL